MSKFAKWGYPLVGIGLLFLFGALYLAHPEQAPKSADLASLLKPRPDDIIYGNPKAPLTVIEYASLTCSHCARFHSTTLPVVARERIETGEVRLVFRHYPLDAAALTATHIVTCFPKGQQAEALDRLFFSSRDWSTASDVPQAIMASLGRMSDGFALDACMASKANLTPVLEGVRHARDALGIMGTPTFLIGTEKILGAPPAEAFIQLIDKAQANGESNP